MIRGHLWCRPSAPPPSPPYSHLLTNHGRFSSVSSGSVLQLPVGQLSALAAYLKANAQQTAKAKETTFHVHIGAGRLGLGLVRKREGETVVPRFGVPCVSSYGQRSCHAVGPRQCGKVFRGSPWVGEGNKERLL